MRIRRLVGHSVRWTFPTDYIASIVLSQAAYLEAVVLWRHYNGVISFVSSNLKSADAAAALYFVFNFSRIIRQLVFRKVAAWKYVSENSWLQLLTIEEPKMTAWRQAIA